MRRYCTPGDILNATLFQFFMTYSSPVACTLALAAAAAPIGPVQSAACCNSSACNTADAPAVYAPVYTPVSGAVSYKVAAKIRKPFFEHNLLASTLQNDVTFYEANKSRISRELYPRRPLAADPGRLQTTAGGVWRADRPRNAYLAGHHLQLQAGHRRRRRPVPHRPPPRHHHHPARRRIQPAHCVQRLRCHAQRGRRRRRSRLADGERPECRHGHESPSQGMIARKCVAGVR